MLTGVNLTSFRRLPTIQKLVDDIYANFYEILIDNFLHLDPDAMKEVVGNKPLAFHIMWSRFLERDIDELKYISERIKLWSKTLKPLYVSDHLAQFTLQTRYLPILAELEYRTCYKKVRTRVLMWQDMLESQIAFENFPSTLDFNFDQIHFYQRLIDETRCQLLFDFSNAKIAEINCGSEISNWQPLLTTVNNFHVAGFRMSDTNPSLAMDTHDVAITAETIEFIKATFCNQFDQNKTIVVERDANIDYYIWKQELITIKNAINMGF